MRIDLLHKVHADVHNVRRGDRVYQRVNPWHTGTVLRREKGYGLTVRYDDGGKYSYPESRVFDFLVGRPTSETLARSQPGDDEE